ncbi:MAG: LptF/LptG family permease [Pseudobdellovibrionaceae bacterium]
MSFIRNRAALFYILFEVAPALLMGLLVFTFILLMAQVLRWTEFVLIHGVGLEVIAKIVLYMTISFLPALFPMSLLFAVLLAYGRMSSDSEIVAFKSLGLNMIHLSLPALLLGAMVSWLSIETSYRLAPWGNRQFEVLVAKIGSTKATVTIREGTFSEGFFKMVVYANKVDAKDGKLKDVFIYDENKKGGDPVTIIAKEGELIPEDRPGAQAMLLRLKDGDIHKKTDTHTKIKFETYDIFLTDPIHEENRKITPPSMSYSEIQEKLKTPDLKEEDKWKLETEAHKRTAIAIACFVFAALGVGLGTITNKRSAKSGGLIMCLILIVIYWVLYVAIESAARGGQVPALAVWLPNILFAMYALYSLKKAWQ